MKFHEGEFVYDTKYEEVFIFSSADKFAVESEPDRFRLATDEEVMAKPVKL